MLNGIFSTLSGKYANSRRFEIINNNIANVSTPGYKASRPVFEVITGESTTDASQMENTYVNIPDTYVSFAAAPIVESGKNIDFAIEGDGFFVISTKDGDRYTRNGKFAIDQEKRLVTADGDPVMGRGGFVTVDGQDIFVEADGSVYVDKAFIDVLRVVDFKDRSSIRNYGRNLFVNSDPANPEIEPENYTIRQGFYEASNVDIMREMIDMIQTVRAYEAYSKVDQYFNDILGKLIEVGKI
jgi:flagellar basal-body rod protein FlgF